MLVVSINKDIVSCSKKDRISCRKKEIKNKESFTRTICGFKFVVYKVLKF